MTTTGRDRPALELLKSVGWTLQVVVFAVLALAPVVAGFVAPVGPPQHTAQVADVSAAEAAPEGAVDVADLDAESRDAFGDLVADDGDRIVRRSADPPALFEGETVVVDGDHAFRIETTESGPPLRPVAILGGFLASVVGTLVGGALISWHPL